MDDEFEVDLFLKLDIWIDVPGTGLEVMAKANDPIGKLYFRRKRQQDVPVQSDSPPWRES